MPIAANGFRASAGSLAALSWLNFLIALMQTGFGAFLAVDLASQGWTPTAIGLALSAGAAAGMLAQVPAGLLVDGLPDKRAAVAGAVLAVMVACVLIAAVPLPGPVYAAQLLQGAAGAVLTPAIAALTLALARQDKLGERLGHNVRFAAIGSAAAAGLMGLVGAWLSHGAMFWMAALCAPASLLALGRIRRFDLYKAHRRSSHPSGMHPRRRNTPQHRITQVARNPTLLTFAGCALLFTLGNAALLPTAATTLAHAMGSMGDVVLSGLRPGLPPVRMHSAALTVGAWIVVPQLLAALLSPWLGRHAQAHGRKRVLLLGFAMLPLRGALFALYRGPAAVTLYQVLDGISGAALGVMIPLVVADITRGAGRFNLAIGIVGLAVGVGGALSTALAGTLSDHIGVVGTFMALGAVGAVALGALAAAMPETHPEPLARRHPAAR